MVPQTELHKILKKIKKNASIKLIAHKKNYGQSCSLRTESHILIMIIL